MIRRHIVCSAATRIGIGRAHEAMILHRRCLHLSSGALSGACISSQKDDSLRPIRKNVHSLTTSTRCFDFENLVAKEEQNGLELFDGDDNSGSPQDRTLHYERGAKNVREREFTQQKLVGASQRWASNCTITGNVRTHPHYERLLACCPPPPSVAHLNERNRGVSLPSASSEATAFTQFISLTLPMTSRLTERLSSEDTYRPTNIATSCSLSAAHTLSQTAILNHLVRAGAVNAGRRHGCGGGARAMRTSHHQFRPTREKEAKRSPVAHSRRHPFALMQPFSQKQKEDCFSAFTGHLLPRSSSSSRAMPAGHAIHAHADDKSTDTALSSTKRSAIGHELLRIGRAAGDDAFCPNVIPLHAILQELYGYVSSSPVGENPTHHYCTCRIGKSASLGSTDEHLMMTVEICAMCAAVAKALGFSGSFIRRLVEHQQQYHESPQDHAHQPKEDSGTHSLFSLSSSSSAAVYPPIVRLIAEHVVGVPPILLESVPTFSSVSKRSQQFAHSESEKNERSNALKTEEIVEPLAFYLVGATRINVGSFGADTSFSRGNAVFGSSLSLGHITSWGPTRRDVRIAASHAREKHGHAHQQGLVSENDGGTIVEHRIYSSSRVAYSPPPHQHAALGMADDSYTHWLPEHEYASLYSSFSADDRHGRGEEARSSRLHAALSAHVKRETITTKGAREKRYCKETCASGVAVGHVLMYWWVPADEAEVMRVDERQIMSVCLGDFALSAPSPPLSSEPRNPENTLSGEKKVNTSPFDFVASPSPMSLRCPFPASPIPFYFITDARRIFDRVRSIAAERAIIQPSASSSPPCWTLYRGNSGGQGTVAPNHYNAISGDELSLVPAVEDIRLGQTTRKGLQYRDEIHVDHIARRSAHVVRATEALSSLGLDEECHRCWIPRDHVAELARKTPPKQEVSVLPAVCCGVGNFASSPKSLESLPMRLGLALGVGRGGNDPPTVTLFRNHSVVCIDVHDEVRVLEEVSKALSERSSEEATVHAGGGTNEILKFHTLAGGSSDLIGLIRAVLKYCVPVSLPSRSTGKTSEDSYLYDVRRAPAEEDEKEASSDTLLDNSDTRDTAVRWVILPRDASSMCYEPLFTQQHIGASSHILFSNEDSTNNTSNQSHRQQVPRKKRGEDLLVDQNQLDLMSIARSFCWAEVPAENVLLNFGTVQYGHMRHACYSAPKTPQKETALDLSNPSSDDDRIGCGGDDEDTFRTIRFLPFVEVSEEVERRVESTPLPQSYDERHSNSNRSKGHHKDGSFLAELQSSLSSSSSSSFVVELPPLDVPLIVPLAIVEHIVRSCIFMVDQRPIITAESVSESSSRPTGERGTKKDIADETVNSVACGKGSENTFSSSWTSWPLPIQKGKESCQVASEDHTYNEEEVDEYDLGPEEDLEGRTFGNDIERSFRIEPLLRARNSLSLSVSEVQKELSRTASATRALTAGSFPLVMQPSDSRASDKYDFNNNKGDITAQRDELKTTNSRDRDGCSQEEFEYAHDPAGLWFIEVSQPIECVNASCISLHPLLR